MAEFPLLVCSWIEQESRGGSIGVIGLFRREVLERQGNRLLGEINLALPLGWQAIGYLLGAVALAGALFVSTASYTRLATVPGRLIPEAGVAVILPSRAERLKLVASMTVTARIVTRKQSILQWLVEPFVAVSQR